MASDGHCESEMSPGGETTTRRSVDVEDRDLEEAAITGCPSCFLEIGEDSIDSDIMRILAVTIRDAKTVREIAFDLNMPLASTYRLVAWMEDHGILVEVGRVRTAVHGIAMRYISTVKSGSITVENNRIILRCHHKDGTTKVFESAAVH